jgi:hypothetical protein
LVDNVVLSERDDEEDTEEAAADSEGDEPANILLREFREKVEAVHGWHGRDEDDTQTT